MQQPISMLDPTCQEGGVEKKGGNSFFLALLCRPPCSLRM